MSLTIPSIILADDRIKGYSSPSVICAKVLYCQLRRDGLDGEADKSSLAMKYGVSAGTIRKWLSIIDAYGWGLDGAASDLFGTLTEHKITDQKKRGRQKDVAPVYPVWADEETRETIREFYEYRKFIKSPMATDRTANRLVNKLTQFSKLDNSVAQRILQRTIDTGKWTDIYEPKQEPQSVW